MSVPTAGLSGLLRWVEAQSALSLPHSLQPCLLSAVCVKGGHSCQVGSSSDTNQRGGCGRAEPAMLLPSAEGMVTGLAGRQVYKSVTYCTSL